MRRRGREFWTKIVDEYEATAGEPHAEFAARHGVERATFERWLYLLRGEWKSAAGRVRLLPVQVAAGRGERHVVVEVGGGLELRVAVGTDPGYVAALVTALRPC